MLILSCVWELIDLVGAALRQCRAIFSEYGNIFFGHLETMLNCFGPMSSHVGFLATSKKPKGALFLEAYCILCS